MRSSDDSDTGHGNGGGRAHGESRVFVAGTAVAGTQGRFTVYIENSHVHASRIAAALSGESVPPTPELPVLPEA